METATRHGDSQWCEPREAAERLGISTRTLRRMADDGRIPVLRIGAGHRRYRRGDVEALIESWSES